MRIVMVGAGQLAVVTAQILLERDHEVVIIERERERIDAVSDEIDCAFLHGDGSRPAILREADPKHSDLLFCLTGDDQANILASLAGRSVGFERVVTKIEDPEFEHLCMELGLEDTVVPTKTIGGFLADMSEGQGHLEVAAIVKNGARVFGFVVHEEAGSQIVDLQLPDQTRVMYLYREDELLLPDADTRLKEGDEVIMVTHQDQIGRLQQRWKARAAKP